MDEHIGMWGVFCFAFINLFRFHLAMDALALGYAIPAIRAYSGLAPVLDNAHAEHTTKKIPRNNIELHGIVMNVYDLYILYYFTSSNINHTVYQYIISARER